MKSLRPLIDEKYILVLDKVKTYTWNVLVPKKINIAFWRIINNRLPTRDNLAKKGIVKPSEKCVDIFQLYAKLQVL